MAHWIRTPFGMMSDGVGRRMGVLGVVIVEREGAVLRVNLGRPIVINVDTVP